MGPSRKLQRSLPALWARRRENVWRSRQSARISFSWATRSGLELTGRNIGLGALYAGDSTIPSPDSCLHDGEGNVYPQSYRTYGHGEDGRPTAQTSLRSPIVPSVRPPSPCPPGPPRPKGVWRVGSHRLVHSTECV